MKYSYELVYGNGCSQWFITDGLLSEKDILETHKTDNVKSVRFHRHIPNGMHLCSCGNLAYGDDDDVLCSECQEIYGHTRESQL